METVKHSVGILILHRNKKLVKMAKDCLFLINKYSPDVETIVVDNGSTVRDPYWEENADIYVRFQENKGIPRGWNTILKVANGEYISVLNDDVHVRPGYLEAMEAALQEPNAGASNPFVENLPWGSGIQETTKWFSGACFMLPRSTVEKVGYFDERFVKCNFEDSDYWTRLLGSGLKLYTNYAVTVQHLEGQTLHEKSLSQHFMDNKQRFKDKWGFDAQEVFNLHKDFPIHLVEAKMEEMSDKS